MSRSRSPRCRSSNSSPTRACSDEAANYSFVLRGYVRHWLANVWSEFDRIKLTDLVGAGKSERAQRRKIIARPNVIGLD